LTTEVHARLTFYSYMYSIITFKNNKIILLVCHHRTVDRINNIYTITTLGYFSACNLFTFYCTKRDRINTADDIALFSNDSKSFGKQPVLVIH